MTDNSITPQPLDLSKRYWLFSWPNGKARGGFADFDDAFETIPQAKSALFRIEGLTTIATIFDSQEGKASSWFEKGAWIDV